LKNLNSKYLSNPYIFDKKNLGSFANSECITDRNTEKYSEMNAKTNKFQI
jgi:hypothetical protein